MPQDVVRPDAGEEVTTGNTGLVDLTGLDTLKGTTVIQYEPIVVTTPLIELNTQVNGEYLDLVPTATELAWAIYRVEPPAGNLLSLEAAGSGPLWLMVADYEHGWVYAGFESGAAMIDLTELGDVISPGGYLYAGVICNIGDTGTLETMELRYDDLGPFNLNITTDEDGATLSWDELDCCGYEVYRSTLADDPYPHHVGTVVEDHDGGNSFIELVPEDELGRWVPENNDNGTAEDTTDDFPTVAPAVEYHYRVRATFDDHDGPESSEVSGTIPWGERSTAIRELADSTNKTQVFASRLDFRNLTTAQIEFLANNVAGCSAMTQDGMNEVRAINPDFVVYGSRYGYLSDPDDHSFSSMTDNESDGNPTPLIYGNEIDYSGDYPYVSRHEGWFQHDEASTNYNNRIIHDEDGENSTYWMEVESGWTDYLGHDIEQHLGEAAFDGWIIDSCTPLLTMAPSQFGELYWNTAQYNDYVDGIIGQLLTSLQGDLAGHPKQPALVADAWIGFNYDPEYDPIYFDYTSCDTIFYSGFLWGGNGNAVDPEVRINDFIDHLGDEILMHQQAGRSVILSHSIRDENYNTTLAAYGCYLLVRGPSTYIYGIPYRSNQSDLYWYPEFSWDTGVPLDPMPTCLDDLKRRSEDQEGNPLNSESYDYYRRDFENGFLLVVPNEMYDHLDEAVGMEQLVFYGGGAVDEDGTPSGYFQWEPYGTTPLNFIYMNTPGCYILREVPAE